MCALKLVRRLCVDDEVRSDGAGRGTVEKQLLAASAGRTRATRAKKGWYEEFGKLEKKQRSAVWVKKRPKYGSRGIRLPPRRALHSAVASESGSSLGIRSRFICLQGEALIHFLCTYAPTRADAIQPLISKHACVARLLLHGHQSLGGADTVIILMSNRNSRFPTQVCPSCPQQITPKFLV